MSDRILSTGTVSFAHTCGNVVEFVHNDIARRFPPNFFAKEFITTQRVFKQLRKSRSNSNSEFSKSGNPKLLITPNFEPDDSIPFKNTMLTEHITASLDGVSRHSLLPIIKDTKRGYILCGRMNRDRLSFDVNLRFDAGMQQLDVFKFMENVFPFERPFEVYTALEDVLPISIVNYISHIIGQPIDINKPSSIPPVLQYLQRVSNTPITYKIRTATAQPEFFLYLNSTVQVRYSDLSYDPASRMGMTTDDAMINFRVTTEFNHFGAYALIGSEAAAINTAKLAFNTTKPLKEDMLIPIYTMERLYEDKNEIFQGFKMYTAVTVKTEADKKGEQDVFDLNDIIEGDIIDVIREYNDSNIPPDILVRFQLYDFNKLLTPGKDFWVDRNTMQFVIENSNPETTYRIIIYLNKIKLDEELQKNMHRASGDNPITKASIKKRENEVLEGYDTRIVDSEGKNFFTRPDYHPRDI